MALLLEHVDFPASYFPDLATWSDRYPTNLEQDAAAANKHGCDAVVFMVFNNFTAEEATDGHEFSGHSRGGLCESEYGRGYAAVVDQGFLGEHWVGPQILAHHLLLLATADLYGKDYEGGPKEERNCPARESLLYHKFFIGE